MKKERLFTVNMKKLLTITLLLTFVSCGENHEVRRTLTNLEKATSKAITDVHYEVSNTMTQTKRVVDFHLTDAKKVTDKVATIIKRVTDEVATNLREFTEETSHDVVKEGGKFGENVGRVPRQVINKLLGTSEDSDEKVSDLEDENKSQQERLDELQAQIDAIKADIDVRFSQTSQDIINLEASLLDNDQELYDIIVASHNQLEDMIEDLETLTLEESLFNTTLTLYFVGILQHNIMQVQQQIDNLEVVCDYLNLGFVQFATYCELE